MHTLRYWPRTYESRYKGLIRPQELVHERAVVAGTPVFPANGADRQP